MGDRANIKVYNSLEPQSGQVFLYTHWRGSDLPFILQTALKKNWRWDDDQYLARIIFDEMTNDCHGQELGFGISSVVWDGADRVLSVDVGEQKVEYKSNYWHFQEYINLNEDQLDAIW